MVQPNIPACYEILSTLYHIPTDCNYNNNKLVCLLVK
jgi:hypothetical protein